MTLTDIRLCGIARELLTRATDREALLIEQTANLPHHNDIVPLVIAAITAPLDWIQLRELLFPISQHMRLDPAKLAHLTDRKIALTGDGRQIVGAGRVAVATIAHVQNTPRRGT